MTIDRSAIDEALAHAREVFPRECCGVLLGRGDSVTTSIRTRNVADSPTRFLIDPQDHFAALRVARALDLQVVGFYHSHPKSRAFPSPTDIAEATYPEAVHLIVGGLNGEPEARLFRLVEGRAVELAMDVRETGASP